MESDVLQIQRKLKTLQCLLHVNRDFCRTHVLTHTNHQTRIYSIATRPSQTTVVAMPVHPLGEAEWANHPSHQCFRTRDNSMTNETSTNHIDRFEAFLLGADEKKVEEKLDTRMPNTSIFNFNKEDHTLGNLLRSKLLSNSHVNFSGYRVPHPLFPTFELRIQTDGEITPKEALLAACRDLVSELSVLDREFTKEYELRKMVSQTQNG